eukprot:scaffold5583_cov203-Alexandrium_tamarense.AAC.3
MLATWAVELVLLLLLLLMGRSIVRADSLDDNCLGRIGEGDLDSSKTDGGTQYAAGERYGDGVRFNSTTTVEDDDDARSEEEMLFLRVIVVVDVDDEMEEWDDTRS